MCVCEGHISGTESIKPQTATNYYAYVDSNYQVLVEFQHHTKIQKVQQLVLVSDLYMNERKRKSR